MLWDVCEAQLRGPSPSLSLQPMRPLTAKPTLSSFARLFSAHAFVLHLYHPPPSQRITDLLIQRYASCLGMSNSDQHFSFLFSLLSFHRLTLLDHDNATSCLIPSFAVTDHTGPCIVAASSELKSQLSPTPIDTHTHTHTHTRTHTHTQLSSVQSGSLLHNASTHRLPFWPVTQRDPLDHLLVSSLRLPHHLFLLQASTFTSLLLLWTPVTISFVARDIFLHPLCKCRPGSAIFLASVPATCTSSTVHQRARLATPCLPLAYPLVHLAASTTSCTRSKSLYDAITGPQRSHPSVFSPPTSRSAFVPQCHRSFSLRTS